MYLEDPAFTIPTGKPAPVDPQIAEFMRLMAKDAAQYPRRDTIGIEEGRANAEKVRLPWAQGGPKMAKTVEHRVGTRFGTQLRVRVHYPAQRKLAGALVYIHGGGFVLFSIDTHDRIMREYADRAGVVVIGMDYTLAPGAKFPQPLEECIDVFRWVHDNAAMLDVDPKQLFLGGDSAGANMTMGACLTLRDAGLSMVKGVVLNYGGFGSNLFRNSVVRYGSGEYGLSLHMMIWFRGMHMARGEDFINPRADILRADLRGLPPAYLVVTECDPLHDDSVELERKMREAGVEVQSKVYPGTVHSFLEAVSIADIAGVAFDDTARWLQAHSEGHSHADAGA